MIRYSSFNYVALLHSLLANVSAHRSREWGTIAAVVRWRPPWFIVFWQTIVFRTSKHTDSYMRNNNRRVKKELQIVAILAAGSKAGVGRSSLPL